MSSPSRSAVAAILAMALVAVPLAADHCSAFCEVHHDTVASTPSCHHSASTTMRMGHAPAPCGHDHNATAARISAGLVKPERAFHSTFAVLAAPGDVSNASRQFVVVRRLSSSVAGRNDRSVPLRI
jgi:hypothetical protein